MSESEDGDDVNASCCDREGCGCEFDTDEEVKKLREEIDSLREEVDFIIERKGLKELMEDG